MTTTEIEELYRELAFQDCNRALGKPVDVGKLTEMMAPLRRHLEDSLGGGGESRREDDWACQELEAELHGVREEAAELADQAERLRGAVGELKRENESLGRENRGLKQEVEGFRAELRLLDVSRA